MARKTKTSKKSQENKESTQAEVVEDAAVDANADGESKLTEDVSETTDTLAETVEDAVLVDETAEGDQPETMDEGTEEPSATDEVAADADAPPVDEETASSEAASEAAEASDGEGEEKVEDEDPVDTTVAGVVPAQAEDTKPAPPPPPPPAPAPAPSAFPLVLGGLIAGAAGFLVATFAVPEGWPNPPADEPPAQVTAVDPETVERVDALSGDVGSLSESLAALSDRLDNLPEPSGEVVVPESVDLTPITDRLQSIESDTSGLGEAIAALQQTASELSARIDEVAERPNIVSPDGSAAMEAQLETFRRDLDAVTQAARAEIEDAQSRANQIEADAAAAAAEAARNAAMADVRAALESGEPFADALAALGDVPEALSSVAADGVTPMAALQNSFPDAARGALQQVQSVPEDASATDRVASFLRRHTNARSLAPREGDDPDAILSRAEAALSAGDVEAALSELQALPEGATASLQGWIDNAQTRAAAVAAMNEME